MLHTEPSSQVYVTVTEKPRGFAAYQVRDFENDASVDIQDEALRCAVLPGIRTASVEYGSAPGASLVLVTVGETPQRIRPRPGEWIVVRPFDAGAHPLDVHGLCYQLDVSGQFMCYSPSEFEARYFPLSEKG